MGDLGDSPDGSSNWCSSAGRTRSRRTSHRSGTRSAGRAPAEEAATQRPRRSRCCCHTPPGDGDALTRALHTLGPCLGAGPLSSDEGGTNLLIRRPPPRRWGGSAPIPTAVTKPPPRQGLPTSIVHRHELAFDLDLPSDTTVLRAEPPGRTLTVCRSWVADRRPGPDKQSASTATGERSRSRTTKTARRRRGDDRRVLDRESGDQDAPPRAARQVRGRGDRRGDPSPAFCPRDVRLTGRRPMLGGPVFVSSTCSRKCLGRARWGGRAPGRTHRTPPRVASDTLVAALAFERAEVGEGRSPLTTESRIESMAASTAAGLAESRAAGDLGAD